METELSLLIGILFIIKALCAVRIGDAITHAAETIAKAIKEKK